MIEYLAGISIEALAQNLVDELVNDDILAEAHHTVVCRCPSHVEESSVQFACIEILLRIHELFFSSGHFGFGAFIIVAVGDHTEIQRAVGEFLAVWLNTAWCRGHLELARDEKAWGLIWIGLGIDFANIRHFLRDAVPEHERVIWSDRSLAYFESTRS